MADTVYLTPDEWKLMAQGIDFTDLTDEDLEAIISRASRLGERFAGIPQGGSWLFQNYSNEQYEWHPRSRRVYPRNLPISDISGFRLRISPSVVVNFTANNCYINNTQGYVELSAMTLAVGLTPDIVELGLVEPVVEFDYTAGYETIPEDIKDAVAIIGSALIVSKKAFEENTAGALSFTIGSYQVVLAPSRPPAGKFGDRDIQQAGFANFVPDAAKVLLRPYARPFLR